MDQNQIKAIKAKNRMAAVSTMAKLASAASDNMRVTKSTFGTHETLLPDGSGLRAVVSKRSANRIGANRGAHLTANFVHKPVGGEWKAVTRDKLLDILGGQ